jgi:hypothetical protein
MKYSGSSFNFLAYIKGMDGHKTNPSFWWFIVLLGLGAVVIVIALVMVLSGERTGPSGVEDIALPEGGTSDREGTQVVSRIDDLDLDLDPDDKIEPIDDIEPFSNHYRGIRARVIDDLTGKPITRATIWFCKSSEGPIEENKHPGNSRILRDARGILRIHGLEEGRYSLLAKAQGYVPYQKDNLKVPQEKEYVTFKMSRGTFLEGRVVTQQGAPAPSIQVYIDVELDNPDDSPPARRAAQTDSDGGFLFGDLPAGRYTIYLNSMHQPLAKVTDIFLPRGGNHFQNLVMPALNTVQFEIRDAAGNPIVTAGIKLKEKTGKSMFTAKTDRQGMATCRYVPSGDYELRIYKSTYEYLLEENFKILSGSDIIRVSRVLQKE